MKKVLGRMDDKIATYEKTILEKEKKLNRSLYVPLN
jgi:hypothetical protein